MSPIVSVIVPCYNGESYVGQGIESALTQSYRYVEVIVIDDGSTDSSLDVIRSFGDAVRWESTDQRGGCAARNRGIELAKGDFVQFLDADDVLFTDKLNKQVRIAAREPNRITYTDHECRSDALEERVEVRSRPVTDPDPFVFVLQHSTLHISGPLYRKSWLQSVNGFRKGLRRSQEFEMNLRLTAYLSRQGVTFLHIPEALFEVRRRKDSLSSNTALTFSEKANYLPEIAAELCNRDEMTAHRQAELAAYAANVGRQCIRGGEVAAGVRLIQFADSLDRSSAEARAWGAATRLVKRTFGPVVAERLSQVKRGMLLHK